MQFSTNIVDGELSVIERLFEFGLSVDQIVAVGSAARAWANDASPLMPRNAPGTLAYIFGVAELRKQLLHSGWQVDRTSGVEAVVNRERRLRIGFQNVDRACDPVFRPIPRSAKGSASEDLCGPNLFEYSGVEPGPLTGVLSDGIPTFYVMVGEDGSVEFSQPVIANGAYKGFVERIFIRSSHPDWIEEIDVETGPITEFDVPVALKG